MNKRLHCQKHEQEITNICVSHHCESRLLCQECTIQHYRQHPTLQVNTFLKLTEHSIFQNSLHKLSHELQHQRVKVEIQFEQTYSVYADRLEQFRKFLLSQVTDGTVGLLNTTAKNCQTALEEEGLPFKRKVRTAQALLCNREQTEAFIRVLNAESASYKNVMPAIEQSITQAFRRKNERLKRFKDFITTITAQLNLYERYVDQVFFNDSKSGDFQLFLIEERLTPKLLNSMKDTIFDRKFRQVLFQKELLGTELQKAEEQLAMKEKDIERHWLQMLSLKSELRDLNLEFRELKEQHLVIASKALRMEHMIGCLPDQAVKQAEMRMAKGPQKKASDLAQYIGPKLPAQLALSEKMNLSDIRDRLQSIDLLKILHYNKTLKDLNISGYKNLSGEVFELLFGKDLRRLVISFTNLSSIVPTLTIKCCNLEVLEAEQCGLTDSFAAVIPYIPLLRKLSLAKNHLTYRFIDEILSLTHLEHLNLSINNMSGDAAYLISRKFSFLKYLNLSKNELKNQAILDIAEFMKDLQELYLHDCMVEAAGAMAISQHLHGTLRVLNISRNNIGQEGVVQLILSLKKAECLYLKNNGLDSQAKARVNRIVSKAVSNDVLLEF